MTPRLVARLIAVLALLVPMTISAQTFIPKDQKPLPTVAIEGNLAPVRSNLSITLNPTGVQPAKLKYTSSSQNIDAQGETVQMTYAADGLSVEMRSGRYTTTYSNIPWQSRGRDRFKTLYLTFAPNGDMIVFRASKD